MTTYLLSWNPKVWEWENIQENIAKINQLGYSEMQWSTGVTKTIEDGDRVFVMKLGIEPRGIVASGWATSSVKHSDNYKARSKPSLYIKGYFDTILKPNDVFPIEFLQNDILYKRVYWTPQASGMRIPDDIAEKLEKDWAKFLKQPFATRLVRYADETELTKTFYEGAVKQVRVNRFERDRGARSICIKKFGVVCSVCKFDFDKKFGEIGIGYIHVHHLKPLSKIRKGYKLNPIQDLRPVCPNCHAMLHQKKPDPYTIEELKAILKGVSNG